MPRRVRAATTAAAAKKNPLQVDVDIYSLRNRGQSWEQISLAMGLPPDTCKARFEKALQANLVTNIVEYINTELAHTYELDQAIWPHVMAGSVDHIRAAMDLVQLRMKLFGAEQQLALINGDGSRGALGSGTVMALTAGGDEESFIEAMERAKDSVDRRSA